MSDSAQHPNGDKGPADAAQPAEQALIEACRAGEEAAFAMIYRQYAQGLYGTILRLLGDAHEAEDAVQETFMRAFRHLHGFRGEASLKTWLYRIAVNHCRNVRDRWQRKHVSPVDEFPQVANGTTRPDTALQRQELRRRIQAALAALPAPQREALSLCVQGGLSYEECAAAMDISADSVRGLVHRARQGFRKAYGE
ncbi:MAG: sigma-70 family RNA polymerase sigma factor [Kiritimatiellae bacterium]|nr:sigma-70 family RNA polymerase sigma factor [Kiritimatiellia bacterium]